MAHLALALLGPFEATLNGLPVEGLTSPRLRALLAYLAVERGREHPREQVAFLLWPEQPDRKAIASLRSALSKLHTALCDRRAPSPFLLVSRTAVQFNVDSDHWLDVAEFERLAGHGREDPLCLSSTGQAAPTGQAGLAAAAALYRGPFLHGLSVADSPAFDEWLLLKDDDYRRAALAVLARLTSLHLASGDYQEAARWARRQLELEPYREQAHRQLMLALALGGERPAALAQYEAWCRLLAKELGCGPEDETQALYAQIRDGGLPQPQPATLTRSVTVSERAVPAADSAPPTRFVAREQELARLGSLLERALAGHGGVALITGEAGQGKTALVDEFAWRACQAQGDLIALRGNCNAHGGAGDPYLPFREILRTLAGDVEGKRAGGALSQEQAQRAWAALPAMGAALVEHGPDLIDSFVPGAALLRRAEAFAALGLPQGPGPAGAAYPLGPTSGQAWQARLREIALGGHAGERTASTPAPQPDLFAQVTEVLHSVSARSPLLLAVDDVQWADSGTAALLFHLGRRLVGSRILLVCAYRPEALHEPADPKDMSLGSVLQHLIREWGDIVVDLDRSDGRAFVEAYVDSEPNGLGAAFRQALYDHTGGNPLFTVELLRTFQERGDLTHDEKGRWVERPDLRWERLPPRVEAIIAERVGRLPRERLRLLEAASVEGESFSAEVAARALGAEASWALQWLSSPLCGKSRLVQAIGVRPLPAGRRPLSRYRFAHALFQKYLYGRLDAVDRAHLHGEVGAALEGLCRGDEGAVAQASPQLARHFEEAGQVLEAARYRLEAGRWAAKLAAYEEAIAHLERGLALLQGMAPSGPSPERLRLELRLCTALCTPVMLQRGWQAPAYRQAVDRLSDLTQHPDLQDDAHRLAALTVLALSAGWSADPGRSGRVGQQLLDLASSEGSPRLRSGEAGQAQEGDLQSLMLGHWALGLSHWLQGQPVPAREHLGRAVALYDPDANRPLGGLVAVDPGVMAHAVLGAVLWQLGCPDQAQAGFRQAVAQAQALEQPSSLAFAHFVAMMFTSLLGRDVAAALSHCQALRPLGQLGLVYGVWAELLAALEQTPTEASGQAQGGAGPAESCLAQGVARAVEALSTWQAAGSGAGYAALLLLQAEVFARAGRADMGLGALDRARAWIERTGVRLLEAEVWRMRGELLLRADDRPWTLDDREPASSVVGRPPAVAEAEACFRDALAVAGEQGSHWWELRAAASLVRLREQHHGPRSETEREGEAFAAELAEARQCLREVYGRFTEGFALPDLRDAAALIGE